MLVSTLGDEMSNKMNTSQLTDSHNHALHASASASMQMGSEAEAKILQLLQYKCRLKDDLPN